ncbi:hypothetical protein GFS60_01866 [Rhodococcus sp. WAY2]|nr:hypothetical protein GFS60_01866 [Rhodococcus sp. WAY2]
MLSPGHRICPLGLRADFVVGDPPAPRRQQATVVRVVGAFAPDFHDECGIGPVSGGKLMVPR